MKRFIAIASAAFLFCSATLAQKKSNEQNDRPVLEQILKQTYVPTVAGKQLLGIGAEADVRQPGTIVVIQRPGLYGSFQRNEPASSAIHGAEAKLFRGHKDYEVPPGERYYVTTIAVASDTILIALLSARPVANSSGSGRVWTTLSFTFPAEVLAKAEKDAVFPALDQWFLAEGPAARNTLPPPSSTPVAAPVAIAAVPTETSPRPAPGVVTTNVPASKILEPGMSRAEVVGSLGQPIQIVQFQNREWLLYPVLSAVLQDGKLERLESPNATTARLNIQSNASGAEIYVDDKFSGNAPSSLNIVPGVHTVRVQAAGHENWSKEISVTAGSDVTLVAKLQP